MAVSKQTRKTNPPKVEIVEPAEIRLDMDLVEKCEKYYRLGLHDSTIANLIGVNPETLKEWLIRGMAYNRGIEAELFKRCAKALGESELRFVAGLTESALGRAAVFERDKDGKIMFDMEGKPITLKEELKPNPVWQSWFLERRFRKKYGRTELKAEESVLDNPMLIDTKHNGGSDDNKVSPEQEQNAINEIAHIHKQLQNAGIIPKDE